MSERRWTGEHGKDGLRDKFAVYKGARLIGQDGEFVFVLRPETDREAWMALDSYAGHVRQRAPQLATDIRARLADIQKEQHG